MIPFADGVAVIRTVRIELKGGVHALCPLEWNARRVGTCAL